MREVWDNMEASNLRSMVQGSGYLERIIIAHIYPTTRHSSSCFIWMNSFIPSKDL